MSWMVPFAQSPRKKRRGGRPPRARRGRWQLYESPTSGRVRGPGIGDAAAAPVDPAAARGLDESLRLAVDRAWCERGGGGARLRGLHVHVRHPDRVIHGDMEILLPQAPHLAGVRAIAVHAMPPAVRRLPAPWVQYFARRLALIAGTGRRARSAEAVRALAAGSAPEDSQHDGASGGTSRVVPSRRPARQAGPSHVAEPMQSQVARPWRTGERGGDGHRRPWRLAHARRAVAPRDRYSSVIAAGPNDGCKADVHAAPESRQ